MNLRAFDQPEGKSLNIMPQKFQPWSLSRRGAVATRRIITAWRIIPALEISSSRAHCGTPVWCRWGVYVLAAIV